MALETTKHFDAPQAPSALQASLRLVATRWGTFIALVVLTTGALLAEGAIVALSAADRAANDAAFRATAVVVLVEPQATPADAEGIGALLRSIPDVVDASFRPKEDALKDLATRGLPPPDGRNPLPDAWLVRLGPTDDGGPLPGERLTTVARAASALPHVAGTRLDDRWASQLDRTEARRRRFGGPARFFGLGTLAILLLCVGALGGASLCSSDGPPSSPTKFALTFYAILTVVVSAVFGFGCCIALSLLPNLPWQGGVQSVEEAFDGGSASTSALVLAAGIGATIAVLWCGMMLGRGRRVR